jgi:hypothetical protein
MTEMIMNFNFNYCFVEDTFTQSNPLMWSPLLSSHLYLKVTILLPRHRKYYMNLTSFKSSPVLKYHFCICPKGDLLIQVLLYLNKL